ncbi:MAG: tetratricopeptide repeat protein [Vicinamibacterales bacterium]
MLRILLALSVALGLLGSAMAAAQDQRGRASQDGPQTITFHQDVAPLIGEHCSACHRPGGGAPFSLLTYQDVRDRAAAVATAVSRRVMPPWKPVAPSGTFVGERRLTDADVDLIQQWVRDGAPEGTASDRPGSWHPSRTWRLGHPDLVVEMPEYVLEAGRGDVYRSFVLPIPLAERRYVRGIEFRPGAPGVVHHANMRFDCTGRASELDRQDLMPGYENISLDAARPPEGHFLGWTPGQVAPLFPEALSWPLEPGCDLVLELHMQSAQQASPLTASLGFYFSEHVPTRTLSLIRLGPEDIDIPPGRRDYTIRDTYVLPVDVEVHTVQAHAHHLATTIRGSARQPDGTEQTLLQIDDWDFDWQDVYHYARPFWLPKGTTLVMEYTYDNSAENPRNPHTPPRRVRFGQRTTDEMGFMWIQAVTRTISDRALLNDETWRRNITQDVVGLEVSLEEHPTDARLHAELAHLHRQLDNPESALVHWRESIRLDASSSDAHYELGTLLLDEQSLVEAEVHLREAVRLEPTHSEAHNNLGAVMVQLGRRSEAISYFLQALSVKPTNGQAHYNLGRQLDELHEVEEASRHYQAALCFGLDDRDVNVSLASALARLRKFDDAVRYYERAIEHDPDLVPALVDLAWIVARRSSNRYEPARAIRLAKYAKEIAERQGQLDPVILEALAIAYASDARYDDAIEAAEHGLRLIGSAGRETLSAGLRQRIQEWTALSKGDAR